MLKTLKSQHENLLTPTRSRRPARKSVESGDEMSRAKLKKRLMFELQAVQASVLEEPGAAQRAPTQTPSGQAARALPILVPLYPARLHWGHSLQLSKVRPGTGTTTDKRCETPSRQGETKPIVSSGATIHWRSVHNYEC